jgi:hypothetical protein
MQEPPSLDDLIALARSAADSDDPIDELAAAAGLKSDLDELTDALLGHFVDQARRAGRSWSQIGEALGVTKQAAQQKHASTESVARRMLSRLGAPSATGGGFMSRFTTRAKAAIVAAQAASTRLEHGYIGTEHLLLGLFADPDSLAAHVLAGLDVAGSAVEDDVVEAIGRGLAISTENPPFTPRAKRALELSMSEALTLGHNYIGTEHILLGLIAEETGVAADILRRRGVGHADARSAVVRSLTGLP